MFTYLLATVVLLGGGDPPESQVSAARHYQACQTRTGGNATVIVPQSPAIAVAAGVLEPGDEIAALTPSGECAGVAVWNGEGTAITLWEDDPFTPLLDGFRAGDPLAFEVYDASEGRVQAGVDLSIGTAFGAEEAFAADALYVVDTRSATQLEEGPNEPLALGGNYPNPFRGSTTLPVTLGEGSRLVVDVIDALGRLVSRPIDREMGAGEHAVTVEMADLAPGLYVFRATAGGAVVQRPFTVAR